MFGLAFSQIVSHGACRQLAAGAVRGPRSRLCSSSRTPAPPSLVPNVPIPLCKRIPEYTEPLGAVLDWRKHMEARISQIGNAFEEQDLGPSQAELRVILVILEHACKERGSFSCTDVKPGILCHDAVQLLTLSNRCSFTCNSEGAGLGAGRRDRSKLRLLHWHRAPCSKGVQKDPHA